MEIPLNDYEVTYILRPNLEEAQVDERAEQIAQIIRTQGGEIVATEKLGKKRLAYEINDLREGTYVAMQFKSTGVASKELERQLKLQEDVMRHIVIHLDKKALIAMAQAAANPAPLPMAADGSDDRGRGRDRGDRGDRDRDGRGDREGRSDRY